MAIIKKFNKALENLNKDPNAPSDSSSDDEMINDQSEHEKNSQLDEERSSQFEKLSQDVRKELETQLYGSKLETQNDEFERLSERAKKSQPIELGDEKLAVLTEHSLDQLKPEQEGYLSQEVHHESSKKRESSSQKSSVHGSVELIHHQSSKVSAEIKSGGQQQSQVRESAAERTVRLSPSKTVYEESPLI